MTIPAKLAKHIPSYGQQMVWGSVALTNGGITAQIMPAGGVTGQTTAGLVASGQPLPFTDIYGVSITSSDTSVQKVTLTDGVNSVVWQVGSSPVEDDCVVPYRFAAGQPLYVSSSAVTSGKEIDVSIRGVSTRT